MDIKLILKISERVFYMFWHGEKFKDIKSMCFVEYGNYLHDKKNINEAIKYYNKALSLNSNNYYAYAGLSAAFLEKREFLRALEYCNKAKSTKSDILIDLLLIIIYESLGDKDLVNEVSQKALEFFKNNSAALYNRLSYTYFQLNMYNKAEHYCKEALKICPNESGLHNNLAKIYLAQNRFQEAREEFQKVI
ncbi:MAG: tetratricopeptide repeat protein, partial [Thermodesulfovibrionales bacterium]